MSIPIGFDSVEEIANLALFTRAKQKKAFDRGIIRQKNTVTLFKANKEGIGYFELSSNTALLRKVANIAETAKKYPALTPLVRRNASQSAEEIRKLYLKAIGGPKTLTELVERVDEENRPGVFDSHGTQQTVPLKPQGHTAAESARVGEHIDKPTRANRQRRG